VIEAAKLVKTGKVICCGLPYDEHGPQKGDFGRINPVHMMLADGGDVVIGAQDHIARLRYADDAVYMPLQCGTQWDALSHIFYDGRMYNGYDVSLVNSQGTSKNGVEVFKDRLVGRGILLDIPRHRGVDWLEPGDGISDAELAECASRQGIEVRRGDIVLVRTGAMARVRAEGSWGDYAAGDAPGLALSSAHWLYENEIAAVATDTWGCEVRPNETEEIYQPLHVVLIVTMGMPIGEIFDFEALATECANDGSYEFMFVAPPLAFTGAVGGPLNPVAIK
jgi:kynurenine formamidase